MQQILRPSPQHSPVHSSSMPNEKHPMPASPLHVDTTNMAAYNSPNQTPKIGGTPHFIIGGTGENFEEKNEEMESTASTPRHQHHHPRMNRHLDDQCKF
jgi:hypothetical protein